MPLAPKNKKKLPNLTKAQEDYSSALLEGVLDRLRPSLVLMLRVHPGGGAENGTGFLVRSGNLYLITCEHVAAMVSNPATSRFGVGVVSLASAGAAEIEAWPGYIEPPVLWMLAMAPPSMRKSPAFTLATAPLRAWEAECATALHVPMAKHRVRRAALEKRVDKLKGDLARADDPQEVSRLMGEMDRATEELAACPDLLMPSLTTSDVTPEGLADLMQRNGGPVGIVDDEGAAVACLLGRYSEDGSRVELANKGYSGTPASIARKGRDPLIVQRPLLAMILAAQPFIAGGKPFQQSRRSTECQPTAWLGGYSGDGVTWGGSRFADKQLNVITRHEDNPRPSALAH